MENRDGMLEDFKKAVAEIWLRDGQNTWPIEINSIVHLFMDIFVSELLEDLERLRAAGFDDAAAAARFKTSARIIRLIMPCVLGMKSLGLPLEKLREHAAHLLLLVGHLKHGDLLNRDGKNIILSPSRFGGEVTSSRMVPADRKSSMAVHKLCAVLWNYAESVCFKTHGLVREFHGPYEFPGEPGEVLCRDFICLRPVELWDECGAVPYEKVRVAALYDGLEMRVDIYNNVFIKEGAGFIGSLRSFYVEADGKVLSLEEIDALSGMLSEAMISITSRIEAMDWRQLTLKYAEIFWFSKKELRDALGEDWRFPPAIEERVAKGEISTRLLNLDRKNLQRMLRIAF